MMMERDIAETIAAVIATAATAQPGEAKQAALIKAFQGVACVLHAAAGYSREEVAL